MKGDYNIRLVADIIGSTRIAGEAGGHTKIKSLCAHMKRFLQQTFDQLSKNVIEFKALKPEGDDIKFDLRGPSEGKLADIACSAVKQALVLEQVGKGFRYTLYFLPRRSFAPRIAAFGSISKSPTGKKYHVAVQRDIVSLLSDQKIINWLQHDVKHCETAITTPGESTPKITVDLYAEIETPAIPASLYIATINSHFKRLNVPRDETFTKAGYFSTNPDRKCIGSIISVLSFEGATGVSPNIIKIESTTTPPKFPSCVGAALSSVSIKGKDGNKAALTDWSQLPLDVDDGTVTLKVARTKYKSKVAMRCVQSQLVDELFQRKARIMDDDTEDAEALPPLLPCQLHCDGLVVTRDNKLILAQRGKHVDIDRFQWAASFGESIDWDKDGGKNGTLHPLKTVWRAMKEELGLPQDWVSSRTRAKITFMELGFQIDSMIYILFSIIELPDIGTQEVLYRARECRTDKSEMRIFDSMEFSVEQCAHAVVLGAKKDRKINYSGRYGLLLASLRTFGDGFIQQLTRM